MKKITFCFTLLFLTVFSSFGQIQIGDGALIDKGVPFEPSRNYSYTQSIYLASEILASGSIASLQWYYGGPFDLIGSQSLTVYIGHTTKTAFTSTSNWEPIANLTEVYTGGISVNGAGWASIPFQTSFAYNGTDNLVIAVKETSPLADYGEDDFFAYEVVDNRSLTLSSNNTVPNPSTPANGTLRKFVPIITLDGIAQACPKPIQLTASDPTTTGISLYWSSMVATSVSSDYYISATNTAPTTTTAPTGSVTTPEVAIVESGLLPATKYYVWVRDICENGPGVWSNASSFVTACEPATSINQNFNSATNGTLPVCWSKVVFHPQGNATTANVSVTNEDGFTGKSVEFVRNGDIASNLILVSPPLSNLGNGTHRLKFYAKHASFLNSGSFQIGTMDGNNMDANFTQIVQIPTTNSFAEYVVDFTTVSTTDVYIGIKLTDLTEYFLGYIDNIVWEAAPLCPDVTKVGITAISTTNATVGWAPDEDVTEWDVVYSTSSTTDPNTLTPITASVNPTANIPGLVAETNYYAWVRTKCTAGNGFWSAPLAFRTPCPPVNSINENFDALTGSNLPNCWNKILRGETLSLYASIRPMMDGANSAPNAIELYSGFSSPAVTDDIIMVSPNLGNLAAGTHRLKFFAKGLGTIEIGTLTGNIQNSQFESFLIVPISDMAMQEYVVDFTSYTGSNTFIGFRLNTTSAFATVLVDDVIWETLPSCPDTTNITFAATTSNATSVGWATSEATQWQIVYGAPSVTDPNTLTPSALLTTPSVDLTDLTSNTLYKVWVRSVCSEADGNGSWSYPKYVRTACDAVSTFSENFESAEAPNLPSCWRAIAPVGIFNIGIGLITWQPYAGEVGVEIYSAPNSNPPILVSPPVTNLSAGTNQLRFFAKHNDGGSVDIGTVNADDAFTLVQTVQLTTTYQEYTVNFASYTGPDTHIGIRISPPDQFRSIGLDNITWETAPACANVTAITVSETTVDTANVNWTAGANETGWQYVYAPSNITDPATLTPSTTLTEEEVELIGLTNGTEYNVWIRSVCSTTAFGSWVGPIAFSTKCAAATLPYTEDFESVITPNLPLCSSVTSTDAINWKTVNNPGDGFTTKTLMYGPNENAANAWFFTRGISLTAGENYAISYKYGNSTAGLHESLRVKYGTEESIAGMTLEIADHADVTGATLQTNTVSFTVPTTGVYYFGFNAYSGANQWELYVDDITIDVNLSNGEFDKSNFTFYPNPVKDILNLSYSQNITNVSVYNLLGQKVLEKNINSNSTQVNMSEFASGSYLVKVTSENQTKTIKVIKK